MGPPEGSSRRRTGAGAALLVVLATTLTFGLFIRAFGLYYDDYPSWSLYLTEGTAALVSFTAGQARPLVGLLPALAGSVAGSHALMLVVHTLNGLAFLALLRRLWPGFDRATTLAAVLFCVYPAYWLRPTHIALAIDGSLLLALLSLWLGLLSLGRSGPVRAGLTTLSMLLVPGYLLLYELPIGLELVRPVLIVLVGRRAGRRPGVPRLLARWTPWLLTLVLFVMWRLLVFRPAGDYARLNYNAVSLPGTPSETAALVGRVLSSAASTMLGAWRHVSPSRATDGCELGIAVGLAVVLVAAAAFCVWRVCTDGAPDAGAAGAMAGLGLTIVVLGQLAPAATGRLAEVEGLSSRWALVSTLGAALVWASPVAWKSTGRQRWLSAAATPVVLALIGIGAFRHVENAFDFARDWEAQRLTWWQLDWRVGTPAPGTVLVLDDPRPPAQGRVLLEYELTLSAELFFGSSHGLVASTSALAAGATRNPRSFRLMGRRWRLDLDRALVVLEGNGCLEVVEHGVELPAGKVLSEDGWFVLGRAAPPVVAERSAEAPRWRSLFGPEPDGWCRLYQAARRAEQRGDAEAVLRLGEEALARDLQPRVPSESRVLRGATRPPLGPSSPPEARP